MSRVRGANAAREDPQIAEGAEVAHDPRPALKPSWKTPFTRDGGADARQRLDPLDGTYSPAFFDSVQSEYFATRTGRHVYDVSPLIKYSIRARTPRAS